MKNAEQIVAHQPAISFSISFQHPFNRAGGRTFNVAMAASLSRGERIYFPLFLMNGLKGIFPC
jgi:hypothetical protein